MAYTGLTAKIEYLDGEAKKEIGYISNFSVELTRDMVEVTKLGSKAKEIKPSLLSWTASAEGTADFAAASGQAKLRDLMVSGTPLQVKFFLDATADKLVYLEGQAYIDSMSMDISAEDKGNISVNLTGIKGISLTENGNTHALTAAE